MRLLDGRGTRALNGQRYAPIDQATDGIEQSVAARLGYSSLMTRNVDTHIHTHTHTVPTAANHRVPEELPSFDPFA